MCSSPVLLRPFAVGPGLLSPWVPPPAAGPGEVYIQSMSWQKFKRAMQVAVLARQAKDSSAAGGIADAILSAGAPPAGEGMAR